jgi:hypothetical protein
MQKETIEDLMEQKNKIQDKIDEHNKKLYEKHFVIIGCR